MCFASWSHYLNLRSIISRANKASLRHPYGAHSKTKIMERVMNNLEQQYEELRGDINQLKEQMSKILEML
ncbi:hypothetical protein CR513_49632, partial [Mucuna pruriens]